MLEDYFKYHPPTTEERVQQHQLINESAMEFAKAIESLELDEKWSEKIYDHIQMARMFANQAVTLKDIKNG